MSLTFLSLFDDNFYRFTNPDVYYSIGQGDFPNGQAHFETFGRFEGRDPGPLFNAQYYLEQNPDVAAAIARGTFRNALDHYILAGQFEGRATTPFFDEKYYLANNPDVANAVRNGVVSSGLEHFIVSGEAEGRRPFEGFNERAYLSTYPDVATAVANGIFRSGFYHYVLLGHREGRQGLGSQFPPSALPDSVRVQEDSTALLSGLLLNDSDINEDPLRITQFSQPSHGSVSVGSNGHLVYKPNANYAGDDRFTYTISDGRGGTALGAVTVSVVPVNDVPTAAPDRMTTSEDTALVITPANVLGNDRDLDGDVLRLVSISQPQNGTIARNANGSYTYRPRANFHGTESLIYQVSDGQGGTASSQLTIQVRSVNDAAPVARPDFATTPEDMKVTIVNVLANDSDVDGDRLSLIGHSQPKNGAVARQGDRFVYTPSTDFAGTDSFTYQVSDGQGGISTGVVTVTVTASNDKPVAVDDWVTATEDTPMVLSNLLSNDYDTDDHAFELLDVTQPTYGTVQLGKNNTVLYTPNDDYAGGDRFTYTIREEQGRIATATVYVEVLNTNDGPVAVDDRYEVEEDVPTVLNVVANDLDIDGDALQVQSWTNPKHGTITKNENGLLIYRSESDFNGPDRFTYIVMDAEGATAVATVNLTVTAVNDAPSAMDDTLLFRQEPFIFQRADLLANDGDRDGDILVVDRFTQPEHGELVDLGNGSYRYTPDPGFKGSSDAFTYTLRDRRGAESTARVTLSQFEGVRVNFQPASTLAVPDYLIDMGMALGDRGNGYRYGWIDQLTGLAANNAWSAYDRSPGSRDSVPKERSDTLIAMMEKGNFAWEMVIPNGTYDVLLGVGDPEATDSHYRISVEDRLIVDENTAVSGISQLVVRDTITVSDGRLTIGNDLDGSSPDAFKNAIAFVHIMPVFA